MRLKWSCLLWFSLYLGQLTVAQETTTQYAFVESDQKELPENIKALLIASFAEPKYLSSAKTVFGKTVYYWFHNPQESYQGGFDVGAILIKMDGDSLQYWAISDNDLGMNNMFRDYVFTKSSLLDIDDMLVIKIYEKVFNDLANRTLMHFFACAAGPAKKMGSVELSNTDNPSDEWIPLFTGDISRFTNNKHTVAFSLKKTVWTTLVPHVSYMNHYVLSKEGLKQVKSERPDFLISELQAQEIIERIFQQYYSAEWKAKIEKPGGKQNRASVFLRSFQELSYLRRGFAPAVYNEACMWALLGDPQYALKCLKHAVILDPAYGNKALYDPDLQSVRQLPNFIEFMRKE